MPAINGRKATKGLMDKGFDKITIVAMTAHAMEGDRAKLSSSRYGRLYSEADQKRVCV